MNYTQTSLFDYEIGPLSTPLKRALRKNDFGVKIFYKCTECGLVHEDEDRIDKHIFTLHMRGTHFKFAERDVIDEKKSIHIPDE